MKLYDLETKEYEMNVRYENKLIKIAKDAMNHMVPTTLTSDDSNTSIDMFDDAVGILTYDIIKNNERHVLNSEAKAFLRVRSLDLYMSRGRLAYCNIPDRKSSVFINYSRTLPTQCNQDSLQFHRLLRVGMRLLTLLAMVKI